MNAPKPLRVERSLSRSQRYAEVVRRTLPVMGGMLSQNVLNLVDTWMVGRTGTTSLAAVATGGMVNFLAVASLMGLSAGVQTVAARRYGEGYQDSSASALNGAIALAVGIGAPITVLSVLCVGPGFRALNPDPAVVAIGVPYLTSRLLALVPTGLNFAFRGYWNGTNRSRLYLYTLLVIHISNIGLNWILIFGNLGFEPRGAPGAGTASAIATSLGTACYFGLGMKHARRNGFLTIWPTKATLRTVVALAAPTCVQQVLFAGGFTAQFWIVGQLGTAETGAAGVLVNVMLVAVLPGLALGITSTSLVSQALGARDPLLAHRWGWEVSHIAIGVALLMALPMWLAPRSILEPFLLDPAAVELAVGPLRVFATAIVLDATGTVLQQSLLGAGANRKVMLVSIACQWGLFLPVAYVLGPVLGHGLLAVWCAHAGYRVLQALLYAVMWQRRTWTEIRF